MASRAIAASGEGGSDEPVAKRGDALPAARGRLRGVVCHGIDNAGERGPRIGKFGRILVAQIRCEIADGGAGVLQVESGEA